MRGGLLQFEDVPDESSPVKPDYPGRSPVPILTTISATLIRKDERVQKPVYFVSKALHVAEEKYPQIETLVITLIMASRKLRPYF